MNNVSAGAARMRLRYSPLSPFVRKVLVCAMEAGLDDRIECVETDVWAADSDIFEDNPFGKVPALSTPNGVFIGSALCCEYLDSLHQGPRLVPADGPERWRTLQRHALADGVMEAAVAHVVESHRRPAELIYQGMLQRQRDKISRGLTVIENRWTEYASAVDLAAITLGCALGYLDFRLAAWPWRPGRPQLERWFLDFSQRHSMRLTEPRLPKNP